MAQFVGGVSPIFDAAADGDAWGSFTDARTIDTTLNDLRVGSDSKGLSNTASWMMFELPIPAGATITNVKVDLRINLVVIGSGGGSRPYFMGWLAQEGIWNVQATEDGWKESSYTDYDSLPHPELATSVEWQGSSPSFNTTISQPPFSGADRVVWAGSGGDFNDASFVSKLQDLFDGNELNRTARGVPVALLLRANSSVFTQFRFDSSNHPTFPERRPVITVDYTPLPDLLGAVSGSARARPAVTGESESRAAVGGSARARPAITGESESRAAVSGFSRGRPAVAGKARVP